MAIRYRKGRASPWQCYWNNPVTGKRECANFLTKREAEKHDSLVKHRIKFDRESFMQEEREDNQRSELTLEMCYLEYLKQKQFTKKGVQWQMDAMRYPLRELGGVPIGNIGRKEVEDIRDAVLATSVSPATKRGRLSVFRTVLRWCCDQGFMESIPFPKLPPAQYEKFIPPTPEELASLMASSAPHIVRVIVLGAQCGVRVGPSEMFCLQWKDVDLSRGMLRIHGAKKNPKAPWREVPIKESLLSVFSKWKAEDDILGMRYLVHFHGKPVDSIKHAWAAALQRAGIRRRIRPYDLRHAFATELIAGGVDIGTVANLMGHSSPTMILNHYQYVMDGQKRAAVEALPSIPYVPSSMCPKKEAPTDEP